MHKCLFVSEIASIICGHLRQMALIRELHSGDASEIYQVRQTLAGLARTCKSLKEPALDALWADLDSLYPLLTCLPVEVRRRSDGSIDLDRPLGPSDFVIFQRHARRVRALGYRLRRPFTSPDLCSLLSSFPFTPGNALLPNLRILWWHDDSDETFPFIRFFVPPTLTSLNLTGDFWPPCKQTFVSFLHVHCPRLQEFSCSEPPPGLSECVSDFIIKADHLTRLDYAIPNRKAMRHLMSKRSLRSLTIHIPEHDLYDRVRGDLTTVESFVVTANRVDQVIDVLKPLKLAPITAHFLLRDVVPAPFIWGFFDQLSKSFDHEKLEVLRYAIDGILENPRENQYLYELETNALEPLLAFKNLVIVRLENFRMPLFDDAMATRLADAWPHLEELKLGTGQDWQTDTCLLRRSALTLYGVGYIAAHCTRLHMLGLVFDPTKECALMKSNWTNENIRIFDVGASPIENPVPIAAALLFLMPKVKEIWAKPPLKNLYPGIGMMPVADRRAERWTLVLEMVTVFGNLRDDAKADARVEARRDLVQELAKQGFLTHTKIRNGKMSPVS
ncbi:hypothetical protein ID866_5380 [Astraeus odoratus]|nr:hypothetical protein ID866_5380 [Astraeus odoratus]